MPDRNLRMPGPFRRFSGIPWVTVILVAVNVIVFFYIEFTGSTEDTDYMIQMGGSYAPAIVEQHEYWRMITHCFLHFGPTHLFNNMISLLILGYATEGALGRIRFLVLYLLSGFLAGVTSLFYDIYQGGEANVSCGASGAIFGLSGAMLILLIKMNRGLRTRDVPLYVVFMALSLYSGVMDPSIDFMGHIGGFFAGVLLCLVLTIGKKDIRIQNM